MATDPAASGRVDLRGAHISTDIRARGGGRLGAKLLLAFALGFGVIIGLGVAIVALVAPSTKPLCQPYKPCGSPPRANSPLIRFTVWRSPQYGYTLEFPGSVANIAQQLPDGVVLNVSLASGNTAAIVVRAAPTAQVSPSSAVTKLIGSLNVVSQVGTDPDPAHALLGGGVGHRLGAGGAYVGSLSSPQGVSSDAGLAAQAATDGRLTIAALSVGALSDTGAQSELYALTDFIVNTVRWPS
jgi:hypothetical protein